MSDPNETTVPPSHPPTKSEIGGALVYVIREKMSKPDITPEQYQSLKHLLTQVTGGEAAMPPKC